MTAYFPYEDKCIAAIRLAESAHGFRYGYAQSLERRAAMRSFCKLIRSDPARTTLHDIFATSRHVFEGDVPTEIVNVMPITIVCCGREASNEWHRVYRSVADKSAKYVYIDSRDSHVQYGRDGGGARLVFVSSDMLAAFLDATTTRSRIMRRCIFCVPYFQNEYCRQYAFSWSCSITHPMYSPLCSNEINFAREKPFVWRIRSGHFAFSSGTMSERRIAELSANAYHPVDRQSVVTRRFPSELLNRIERMLVACGRL
jgi:hypothetical protein